MDIFKVIKTGDLNAVFAYIKGRGNLNVRDNYNMTPLIVAADECRADIVKILIKSKANLNLKDKIGQTALHLAAGRNNLGIVKLLIDAKADMTIKAINGLTAYGFAYENGYKEVAEFLKKAEAK